METFCTEPLLVKGFNITFSPKKKFPNKKTLLNISFLNIPAETPDEPLTEYLVQYADIVGTPLHIRKEHDGIPYYTDTRVYQVNRLYQHLPRHINEMFGRTVLCIYDNQPTDQSRQRNNTKRSYYHRQRTTNHYPTQNEGNTSDDNYSDSENESERENQQKQQQQETAITTMNENQQQNQAENQDQKQKETMNSQQRENVTIRKHKTTSTTQHQINKEPSPKTTENYPEIQKATAVKENKPSTPQTQQQQTDTTIIPETQIVPQTQTQETTQISFLSPSMVTKNRYQILNSTPETIDIKTPESNEPNIKETTSTPTPQQEQHQKAKNFAMRLYKMNFARERKPNSINNVLHTR